MHKLMMQGTNLSHLPKDLNTTESVLLKYSAYSILFYFAYSILNLFQMLPLLTSVNYLNLIQLHVSISPKLSLDMTIFLIYGIIFCSLWSEIRLFGSTDVIPLLCCNIFRWEESMGFMLSVSITLGFNS